VAIGSLELYVTVDIWLPCLVDLLGDTVAGTVLLSREDCPIGFDPLLCLCSRFLEWEANGLPVLDLKLDSES
jgi:hypothetical protein